MQNEKGAFSLEDSHKSSNFVLKYEVQSPDRSAKIRNFQTRAKGMFIRSMAKLIVFFALRF